MKINNIDMERWKEYDNIITDSLWLIPQCDNSGAHNASYHGLFVPDIPRQAMLRYTKEKDVVLDLFAGNGTTLIEAMRLGRHCIGVDINLDVATKAISNVFTEPNPHEVLIKMLCGDSTDKNVYDTIIWKLYQNDIYAMVDLVILHPPYHNIIKFSSNEKDISNCETVDDFMNKMKQVFQHSFNILKQGHYMVLVICDYYANKEHVPLSYYCMQEALNAGFKLKSHVVKDIQNNRAKANQINLWRYRALQGGFYIFKHENIFFFWKP